MNHRVNTILAAFAALLLPAFGHAQIQPPLTANEIASRAAERAKAYTEAFKNLLSEEKKTFEIYDKKGEVKKRRTVDSTFLVYQLSKKEGVVAEFRNVTAVDGKPVANAESRAADFFEKVAASSDSRSELDRIQQESTRFDEDFAINGLTLFPAIALSDELRPIFWFTLAGKEKIDAKDIYVVAYEQIRPNPSVTINRRPSGDVPSHNYDIEIDDEGLELNPRIRGRLWIDADTYNVRKEVRERRIQPAGFANAMVVAEDTFEYGDSDHGILTPRRITHLQYRVLVKDREARKDTKVMLEYGKFTRPDVEVKSSEVKGDKP